MRQDAGAALDPHGGILPEDAGLAATLEGTLGAALGAQRVSPFADNSLWRADTYRPAPRLFDPMGALALGSLPALPLDVWGGLDAGPAAPPQQAVIAPVPEARPEPQTPPVEVKPAETKPAPKAASRPERRRAAAPKILRLRLAAAVIAPMAHVRFCLQYRDDCAAPKVFFRGGPIKLDAARLAELNRINREVNRAIVPEANTGGVAAERWLISPERGDCNDYAVTKRHLLIARGWPAHALLLAEVVTTWGEHHLVLVVRTDKGDLIADNLRPSILAWNKTPYEWVRMQSPKNPMYWASVAGAAA